jgi:hypothetical protein
LKRLVGRSPGKRGAISLAGGFDGCSEPAGNREISAGSTLKIQNGMKNRPGEMQMKVQNANKPNSIG